MKSKDNFFWPLIFLYNQSWENVETIKKKKKKKTNNNNNNNDIIIFGKRIIVQKIFFFLVENYLINKGHQ